MDRCDMLTGSIKNQANFCAALRDLIARLFETKAQQHKDLHAQSRDGELRELGLKPCKDNVWFHVQILQLNSRP